ncbi:MAG: hypothetical protein ABWY00_07320 [Dongiaceae bacterium]
MDPGVSNPGLVDPGVFVPGGYDPGILEAGMYDPRAFGPNEWLEANLALDARYLHLSRPHIQEMCLELKPSLATQIRTVLDRLLRDRTEGQAASLPDKAVEAAIAAATELAGDTSWALTWEQAKHVVEPYAKGSWLLAQVQAHEEQRLIAIYAAELTRQIARYVQELIFQAFGVAAPDAGDTLSQPAYWSESSGQPR